MSTFPMNKQQDFLGGLLSFLQSPQAEGLSQGLLAQAAPSMTEPRSLAGGLSQGLMLGSKYADLDRKRKMEQGHLDIGRGKLEIYRQKVAQEAAKAARQEELLRQQNEQMRKFFGLDGGINDYANQQGESSATEEAPQTSGGTSVSESPTITVEDPEVNNGAPTAIPSTLNGHDLSKAQAVDLFKARAREAEILSNNAKPSGGMLNQQGAQTNPAQAGVLNTATAQEPTTAQGGLLNMDQSQASGTPQQRAPAQSAPVSGGSPGKPPSDEVTLPNGMVVPKEQYKRAQTQFALGDKAGAIKTLTEAAKEKKQPTAVEEAQFLYPDDVAKQREYVEKKGLKPPVQVNLNDSADKIRLQTSEDLDKQILTTAQETVQPGRNVAKLAQESLDIAKQLRKKGIDPGRFWLTKQLERTEIKSALGGEASAETMSLIERLNKNAIYLMSDLVKSLGGRPNQFIEQQFAKAVPGTDVSLRTIEKLSIGLIAQGRENQYRAPFMRSFKNKYGTLEGADEAYNTWLDTNPFVTPSKSKEGYTINDDRTIEKSWKSFAHPITSPEFVKARLENISRKDKDLLTNEELEFIAEYGQ